MSKKKTTKKKTVKKAYIAGKWHGKVNYKCAKCSWSTLNLEEMEKHIVQHAEAEKPKVVEHDTGLVGPGGGKIVRQEIAEPETPPEEETDG